MSRDLLEIIYIFLIIINAENNLIFLWKLIYFLQDLVQKNSIFCNKNVFLSLFAGIFAHLFVVRLHKQTSNLYFVSLTAYHAAYWLVSTSHTVNGCRSRELKTVIKGDLNGALRRNGDCQLVHLHINQGRKGMSGCNHYSDMSPGLNVYLHVYIKQLDDSAAINLHSF